MSVFPESEALGQSVPPSSVKAVLKLPVLARITGFEFPKDAEWHTCTRLLSQAEKAAKSARGQSMIKTAQQAG
eukprot:3575168-Karenia_brevis.AAC.1